MKDFVNETDSGNEPAIRRGKAVPPNGVNVAWAKSPRLSPDKNISIVDFSQLIPENVRNSDQKSRCRFMYANHLGILIDEYNNDIIHDEFPAVTDVFSIDEDFSVDVNIDEEKEIFQIEYKHHHILPFLHVSRYFHVDNAGLTMPGSPVAPPSSSIMKVMREDGTEYLNDDGEKAYRIELVYVPLEYAENEDPQEINNSALYRVNVYVDTESADGLFLQYFKAEYDAENQKVKNYDINYRERLNPFKFFTYIPEESELVDQNYAEFKHYSTKSIGGKAQIYGGGSTEDINGYRVHVPKRAVPDPRIYQLFRWRVRCEFIDTHTTEEVDGGGWEAPTNPEAPVTSPVTPPDPVKPKIKAGIIYHRDLWLTSTATMAFLNLGESNANMHGIEFVNPMGEAAGKSRYTRDYWLINMGTTPLADIMDFDILIISPWLKEWSFPGNWYNILVEQFVKKSGGTLIIDGANDTYFSDNPFTQYSAPVMPSGNLYTSYGGTLDYANGDAMWFAGQDGATHPVINGSSRLAGYELRNMHPTEYSLRTSGHYGHTNLQWFAGLSGAGWATWRAVLSAPRAGPNAGPGLSLAVTNGGGISNGSVVWTTLGFTEDVSRYFNATGSMRHDPSVRRHAMETNQTIQEEIARNKAAISTDINRSFLSGPYKLLYNIALYSVRNKSVSLLKTQYGDLGVNQSDVGGPVGGGYENPDVEGGEFSTTWTGYSKWFTSYVVDGEVLTEQERDELGFTLAPYAENSVDLVWQRVLSTKTVEQIIDEEMGPALVARLGSATRTYGIDVSNDAVEIPETILHGGNSPYAYTNAYSPPFVVPPSLGPHVIKGEQIEEEYAADTGTSATYPPRPYSYRVDADIPKVDLAEPQTATITITGVATKTENTSTPVRTKQTYMTWHTHGENDINARPIYSHYDMPFPRGIHTWQYSNFGRTPLGTGTENWITPGLFDKAQLSGPKNPITTRYIQKVLNTCKFWGFTNPVNYVEEDGIYGPETKANLAAFQRKFQVKNQTGTFNMETAGAMSAQMLRLYDALHRNGEGFPKDWAYDKSLRFIYDTPALCHLRNISDGNDKTAWLKTSLVHEPSKTPASVFDFVALRIPGNHEINAINITPYTRGRVSDILLNSIHVTTTTSHNNLVNYLHNYTGSASQMKNMKRRCPQDAPMKIPVGPITGNTVIIGIGQDKKWGDMGALIFGLRDFGIYAETTSGGVTNTNTTTENISYKKTVTINPGDPAVFITPQLKSDPSLYSSIEWTNVSSSNSLVSAVVLNVTTGKTEVMNTEVDVYDEIHKSGKTYPQSFTGTNLGYSMNRLGNVSAFPESGFISKADGVKIFCDRQGNPNWEMPVPVATSEAEADIQQYTEYTLVPLTNDPMVTMGFYDMTTHTFLFGSNGRSRITLGELDTRGRGNVYIAAASSYQEMKELPLPSADPAKLPYKWAMPVYGICEKTSTRIGIEPISSGLGKLDIWPVGIRAGKFARDVYIRDTLEGQLADWIKAYRGKTLRAFYSIPEMDRAGWSPLLGRPYIDIIDESPIVVDANKIKVRQPPIAMEHESIANGGVSKPARPFMSVYVRASGADPWSLVPWEGILDYRVSKGTVVLKNPIPGGQTEENVKISYSTKTEIYPFKYSEGKRINLNPYASSQESYVNKATYIYILPRVVMGPDGEIIDESAQSNALRFTHDSTIFNHTHPEYNPLAIPLGAVYVNNGSDIEKMILLDTRRRGGGVTEELTLADAFSDYPESENYWDVSPGPGLAYQNGGFIIIRLPSEVKDQFPNGDATGEIKSIISRRLPAGVSFKLENLDGSPWED